ncbi:sedoheptulokinase-like [Hemicordylus capensis]|uniref:sedoheptulokinase-like n=1 Tax=Hemicordylus capensis TaxID=884348 RepID=UPI0023031564|nr:sedoheptulokinase-like [Hemicordylus capensis]
MQMSPRAEGETGSTPAVLLGPSCVLGIDVGTTSVKTGLVSKTEHGPAVTQSCTKETRAQVENAPAGLLQVRLPAGVRVAVELAATGVPPPCRWRGQCQVPERRVTPPPRHPDSALQPHGPGCQWTERGTRPTFEPAEVSHLITWQDGHCSSDLLALLLPPRSHLSVATGFGCATIYWYMENRQLRQTQTVHKPSIYEMVKILPYVGSTKCILSRDGNGEGEYLYTTFQQKSPKRFT